MGAKYLPTSKDLKALQRFRDKQAREAQVKKPSVTVKPPKKIKK